MLCYIMLINTVSYLLPAQKQKNDVRKCVAAHYYNQNILAISRLAGFLL